MNVILCDDEKLFLEFIEQKIMAWAGRTGHRRGLMIHSFTSSEDMLDAWQHGMQVDALFLDIQIPGEMNGMAAAKEIHRANANIPIVFVTCYGEYAAEGYEVNALRYLRKPVSEQDVVECMNILWHRWELQQTACIVLDVPTQILRLPVNAILYIEVAGHYCIIRTTDSEQTHRLKQSMDSLRKKIPENILVQCHRSFIVNLMYIRHITSGNITMADGTVIPMSRSYQAQLLKMFRSYYLEGEMEKCR